MPKITIVFAVALMACSAQAVTAQAGQKRSFEECRKLAIERGVRMPKMPQRYTEMGPNARKPTGFMAQCMSGKLT